MSDPTPTFDGHPIADTGAAPLRCGGELAALGVSPEALRFALWLQAVHGAAGRCDRSQLELAAEWHVAPRSVRRYEAELCAVGAWHRNEVAGSRRRVLVFRPFAAEATVERTPASGRPWPDGTPVSGHPHPNGTRVSGPLCPDGTPVSASASLNRPPVSACDPSEGTRVSGRGVENSPPPPSFSPPHTPPLQTPPAAPAQVAARWGSQPGAAAAAGASLPGWAQRALGALRLTEPTAIAAVVRWAEAQPEPERDLAQVAATAASRRVNDPAALLVSVIRSGTASEWLAEARRSTPPATEPRRPTAAWDCELEQLIFDLVAGLPHDRELAERRATRRFGSVHAAREAWCVFVESVPLEARVPARLEGGVAAWRRLVADYRSRQAAAEEAPAAPVHQLAPSAAPRREVACG